jgi:peptidoglycan/xylan/chitin deacetylase (PgdA/CDA1 family)
MLKYQKIVIVFISILSALALADIFIRFSILWYAGTIIVFTGLMVWGSSNIKSGMFCKTHCRGNMEKRSIALTFDDGPDKTITPEILDLLNKEDITAAFFCIGKKAEDNPDLLKRMDLEGHVIGGHSYSHNFFFDLFGSERMQDELQKTEEVIYKNINRRIRMFRPPYGVTNPPLARAVGKKKYDIIGWSLRSKDTVIQDENRLLRRITGRLKPGDVILFHDTGRWTLNVLEKFIKFAKEHDFRFERPDKHLGIEAYE